MDRAYNIVHTRLSNNRVDSSIEVCSGVSIIEAERKVVEFAEDAIHCIKPTLVETITVTKRSVTIEIKDCGKTTTIVYAVVDAH